MSNIFHFNFDKKAQIIKRNCHYNKNKLSCLYIAEIFFFIFSDKENIKKEFHQRNITFTRHCMLKSITVGKSIYMGVVFTCKIYYFPKYFMTRIIEKKKSKS